MICGYEQTMHAPVIYPPLQPGPSLNHATGVILNSRSPFVHACAPLRTFLLKFQYLSAKDSVCFTILEVWRAVARQNGIERLPAGRQVKN